MFDDNSEQTGKSDCHDSTSQLWELWDLLKLKMPEKGPAVSQSLANLKNSQKLSMHLTMLDRHNSRKT